MATFEDTVLEGLGLSQVGVVGQVGVASDTLGISPRIVVTYRQIATASETLGLQPAVVLAQGAVMREVLGLEPSVLPNQIVGVTATEALRLVEQLLAGVPVTLSETLGLTIVETVQQAIEVIEELGLEPVITGQAVYNLSLSETLGLAYSLANFFGADVVESLNLQPLMAGTLRSQQSLTETLGLSDTLTGSLVLRVDVEEGLGLEDVDLLNAIYTGALSEELGLSLAYISPGGGFTTWAMNTRTAAVTEYGNYEFNSFARLGTTYIGASSSGLYELIGDDDDGTDIVAQIKSGFAQWAGTRFTLFKSAYLGVRGEGDFVLKVITGEGDTYNYAVSTRDMRSTKVHMGKGLRARYFRFELISDGQDFDLESIEFVPLVAQRRV